MSENLGTGSTITFASGFFAEILDLKMNGVGERPAIRTSSFSTTGAHTFIPGKLYDPGTLEVEMAFAPQTTPPFNSAREAVTIVMDSAGTGGTSSWAASGFLIGLDVGTPFEDRITATARVKMSGTYTITP